MSEIFLIGIDRVFKIPIDWSNMVQINVLLYATDLITNVQFWNNLRTDSVKIDSNYTSPNQIALYYINKDFNNDIFLYGGRLSHSPTEGFYYRDLIDPVWGIKHYELPLGLEIVRDQQNIMQINLTGKATLEDNTRKDIKIDLLDVDKVHAYKHSGRDVFKSSITSEMSSVMRSVDTKPLSVIEDIEPIKLSKISNKFKDRILMGQGVFQAQKFKDGKITFSDKLIHGKKVLTAESPEDVELPEGMDRDSDFFSPLITLDFPLTIDMATLVIDTHGCENLLNRTRFNLNIGNIEKVSPKDYQYKNLTYQELKTLGFLTGKYIHFEALVQESFELFESGREPRKCMMPQFSISGEAVLAI
jgi:hypothetical protein